MTIAVITGATHGLGRLVALELARRGTRLGIVARSAGKVADLRAEIEHAVPGTDVGVFHADLSSMREVRRAGEEIAAHYDQIDVLINNAGLHAFTQRITVDGFAEMTAVNYLAPWVLTNTLRDRLTSSAPARVVTVASEAARHAHSIDPERDLTFTGAYTRRESATHYARTKLMAIMFTQELARRLAGTGVTSNCCDPGFNTTGLGRELPFAAPLEKALHALRIGNPRRGARIITHLATHPTFTTQTGGYFSVKAAAPLQCPEPGRPTPTQHHLWAKTAELLTTA